jgi:hypothetical protein
VVSEHCECGVELVFREHYETGKRAPIEAVPVRNGNIRLLPGGRYAVLTKAELETAEPPLYINHYANCPTRGRRR